MNPYKFIIGSFRGNFHTEKDISESGRRYQQSTIPGFVVSGAALCFRKLASDTLDCRVPGTLNPQSVPLNTTPILQLPVHFVVYMPHLPSPLSLLRQHLHLLLCDKTHLSLPTLAFLKVFLAGALP
jgi:hypothetical protein